ncbi:MAG: dTMP kinase [Bdellovibrionota bacterium]
MKSSDTTLRPQGTAKSGPGAFIVFEGGEGTGKTTQIHALKDWLEKTQGREVVVTFEPGGTPLGKNIRAMLLDPAIPKMDARCEALLFAATRAEHVSHVIRPAIEAGKIVLCDRYWDASRAYQGAGRALGFEAIDRINMWGTRSFFPDRVYLFDLDPEKGLERASARQAGKLDRLESESLKFHRTVRESYLYLAHSDPKRYRILDASRSVEDLFETLTKDLRECLTSPSSIC